MELHWIGYIGCVWVNQNYWNIVLPCVPDTLHRAGSQIPCIIINSHQVIGLIYHVAISLDIALTAIFVSDDLFSAAMLQDELHPALAALNPLGVMADKRQGYNQFNISVSRLLLQAKDLFSSPHIHTQGTANIETPDFLLVMQLSEYLQHIGFDLLAKGIIFAVFELEPAGPMSSNGTNASIHAVSSYSNWAYHTSIKCWGIHLELIAIPDSLHKTPALLKI